jgi:hypothetical protein
MANDKKKKISQPKLTQLTCDLRYEAGITQQKGKQNKSRSLRPNNLMSNKKNLKKEPKKD